MELEDGRYCFAVMETEYYPEHGYMACIVIENESGYHQTGGNDTLPWYWGHDFDKAEEIARKKNKAIGLTPKDVDRIIASSMWPQGMKA